MIRKLHSALLGGLLAATFAAGAQALPANPAAVQAANHDITQVRGLCGIGFHRGPYGYCVRNGVYPYPAPVYGAPVYVPPPVVVPRCPYGWYFAYGRCNPY